MVSILPRIRHGTNQLTKLFASIIDFTPCRCGSCRATPVIHMNTVQIGTSKHSDFRFGTICVARGLVIIVWHWEHLGYTWPQYLRSERRWLPRHEPHGCCNTTFTCTEGACRASKAPAEWTLQPSSEQPASTPSPHIAYLDAPRMHQDLMYTLASSLNLHLNCLHLNCSNHSFCQDPAARSTKRAAHTICTCGVHIYLLQGCTCVL